MQEEVEAILRGARASVRQEVAKKRDRNILRATIERLALVELGVSVGQFQDAIEKVKARVEENPKEATKFYLDWLVAHAVEDGFRPEVVKQ